MFDAVQSFMHRGASPLANPARKSCGQTKPSSCDGASASRSVLETRCTAGTPGGSSGSKQWPATTNRRSPDQQTVSGLSGYSAQSQPKVADRAGGSQASPFCLDANARAGGSGASFVESERSPARGWCEIAPKDGVADGSSGDRRQVRPQGPWTPGSKAYREVHDSAQASVSGQLVASKSPATALRELHAPHVGGESNDGGDSHVPQLAEARVAMLPGGERPMSYHMPVGVTDSSTRESSGTTSQKRGMERSRSDLDRSTLGFSPLRSALTKSASVNRIEDNSLLGRALLEANALRPTRQWAAGGHEPSAAVPDT